ncbi:MAG: GNAT family N-acetyltransferase, partial [Clostridia bacterium]|nr:GNAT family N-acetyltransferase [Clostridia bacterium]
MLIFDWSRGLERFEGAHFVRDTVFIVEQGFECEFDEADKLAGHLTGYLDGKPVAAARLIAESADVCHLGRVCVLRELRGRHFGEALVKEAAA